MIDPNESTWHVEPFDLAAWIAFSKRDRFLVFQQRDMIMRSLAAAGEDQAKYDRLIRTYLEAQYNGCHEDSLLARKWNAFVARRNAGLAVSVN